MAKLTFFNKNSKAMPSKAKPEIIPPKPQIIVQKCNCNKKINTLHNTIKDINNKGHDRMDLIHNTMHNMHDKCNIKIDQLAKELLSQSEMWSETPEDASEQLHLLKRMLETQGQNLVACKAKEEVLEMKHKELVKKCIKDKQEQKDINKFLLYYCLFLSGVILISIL